MNKVNLLSRYILLPPASAAGNAFGRVCLCVCLVRALIFESRDLETSFLIRGTSSEYLGQVCIPRSSVQGQGHLSKNVTKYTRSRVV